MAGPTLRELLNRLRWEPTAAPSEVVLTVLSRQEGLAVERAVPFSAVTAVLPAGVALADGTFLPYHRVMAVRVGAETVWRARGRSEHGRA